MRRLIDFGGSTEEAQEIQQKLHDRYTAYLECHETALVEVPEREASLNASHVDVDQRHQDHVEQLQAYIDDGIKSERSLHVQSLFSSRSSNAGTAKTVSNKHSSRRSHISKARSDGRLNEARVQAELAKKNVEQFKALQAAQQKKLILEREAARQEIELERQAARQRFEKEEREQRERQAEAQRRFELDEEIRRKDLQRRMLQEETERQQRELDHEIELQSKIAEMERLKAEVHARENEDLRSVLGSDVDSDEEREDVTSPKNVIKPKPKLYDTDMQQSQMREILQSFTQLPEKAQVHKQVEGDDVSTWLRDSVHSLKSDAPTVPPNTRNDTRSGYIPVAENFRAHLRSHDVTTRPSQNMLRDLKLDTQQKQALDTASV